MTPRLQEKSSQRINTFESQIITPKDLSGKTVYKILKILGMKEFIEKVSREEQKLIPGKIWNK